MGDDKFQKIGAGSADFAAGIIARNRGTPLSTAGAPPLDHLKDDAKVQYEIVFTADEMAKLKEYSLNPGIPIDASIFPNLKATVDLAFKSTPDTPIKITKAEANHLAEIIKLGNTSKPGSSEDNLLKAIITKLQNAGSFKPAELDF